MRRILILLLLLCIPVVSLAEDKANYQWRGRDVIITDDGGTRMEIDPLGYLVVMDVEHHKIHEGEFYVALHIDNDNSLSANDTLFMTITTPASPNIHFNFAVTANAGSEIRFYENPTIDVAAATAITPTNCNRQSSNTTDVLVRADETGGSVGITTANLGTLLAADEVTAGNKITGSARGDTEWILKASEDYLLIVLIDNNNTHVALSAVIYESDE